MTREEIKQVLRESNKEIERIKHDKLYINWEHEAIKVDCSDVEYEQKLKEITSNPKYIRIATLNQDEDKSFSAVSRTKRELWQDNCYDLYTPITKRYKTNRIYIRENGQYYIYIYRKDGKKDHSREIDSVKEMSKLFEERTGITLRKAFSASDYELRTCIPAPLYYLNPKYKSNIHRKDLVKELHCIDGCSQYPTSACGRLPTANHSKTILGTVEPTEEYPFAFYTKSGHVAVYGEFDTHSWVNNFYAESIIYRDTDDCKGMYNFVKNFNPEEDVTVLMKASEFNLEPEMMHFFNIKESYPKGSELREIAKAILNALIGNFHRVKKSGFHSYEELPLNHVAAVIIARANNLMIKRLNKLLPKNIVHVCVDGIMFKGKQVFDDVVDNKHRHLGAFELELTDCIGIFRGGNQYIIKDRQDKLVKVAHSGLTRLRGKLIDDYENLEFDDIFDWIKLQTDEDYYKFKEYKNRRV